MKKGIMITINQITRFFLLRPLKYLPFLVFTFCQEGYNEIIQITNEVISKDSETVFLMKSAIYDEPDRGQCLEYKYPVSFYVYYPQSKTIETVVNNSDEELIDFIEQLKNVDQISIDFPFALLSTDGEETIIRDLISLQETLKIAVEACSGSSNFDFCDDNNKKVNICHNGNTLCVSVDAIQAHLDHGDTQGSCN